MKKKRKVKRNYVPKTKLKVLEILSKAKEQYTLRYNYNKDLNRTSSDPIKQAEFDLIKKNTTMWDKKYLNRINKLIREAKKSTYGRTTKKVLARFADIWNIESRDGDAGYLHNNRETSFRNMILRKLAEFGVDITNPSELNKALQGMDINTIYEIWKDQPREDFYEELSTGGLDFLKDIKKQLKKNKQYKKWQANTTKTLLNELEKY